MNHVTTELPLAAADQIRHEARRQRLRARSGELQAPTTGLAPGAVQGNLAILPKEWAEDFMRFCHLNQNPCPLLTASRPGEYMLDELGHDIDIRTDIPLYRIFKDGVFFSEEEARPVSQTLVQFLIEKGGGELKLKNFIEAFQKSGSGTSSLQFVYGASLDTVARSYFGWLQNKAKPLLKK